MVIAVNSVITTICEMLHAARRICVPMPHRLSCMVIPPVSFCALFNNSARASTCRGVGDAAGGLTSSESLFAFCEAMTRPRVSRQPGDFPGVLTPLCRASIEYALRRCSDVDQGRRNGRSASVHCHIRAPRWLEQPMILFGPRPECAAKKKAHSAPRWKGLGLEKRCICRGGSSGAPGSITCF